MKHTLLLLTVFYTATAYEPVARNPCIFKTTCHECIQTPTCAWCTDPDLGNKNRCFQPTSMSNSFICGEDYIWNPDNEYRLLMNKELSKSHISEVSSSRSSSARLFSSSSYSSSSRAPEIVQLTPQQTILKLRINESFMFRMFYTQAEDYPLDLYYLMDLSKSMEGDKKKLSSLGDLLVESMRNITTNFRLGFGSFVDKVVMPYVSTTPKSLREPCSNCAAPYGFQNIMKLSQNTSQFADIVRHAAISGNLDAPEGGFDAIMQAIVCRKEIGWRENARKLLVFSTQAGFHYAGDGKLGGIITPNDGLCHLDNYGFYTHSTIQDYPSVSQLNLKVKENAVNIIFAVTEEQISIYKELQEHIEGSVSGKLSADSHNIVDLVKEQYKQISSSVEMKDNATSAIKVNYYSKCLDANSTMKQTNKCENIKIGDVVEFNIEIEATVCPTDPKDWKQTIQIYPVGVNESLVVDLEILCSCPCEYPEHYDYIENAAKCSGRGNYKCGNCECNPDFFGKYCECSGTGFSNTGDSNYS